MASRRSSLIPRRQSIDVHVPIARSNSPGDEELGQAVKSASPVPENVTPEDFNRFLSLVNSQSPEEVERKAAALAQAGELTESVLEAGFATLEQAKNREDTDERVIASLQGLCNFLLELYQQINTPTALKLIDEFVQLMKPDQDDSTNEEAVRSAMEHKFLAEDNTKGGVIEFIRSVDGFLESMREQDAEFEEQCKLSIDTGDMTGEQREQLDQFLSLRRAAVQQMKTIRRIAQKICDEQSTTVKKH